MNNLLNYGAQQVSTPNNLNEEMPPAQNFAFGGIANPAQRAYLNATDQEYLDARQKELDKFEQERQAYNNALTTWQTEVYNPYKSKVDEYNAAAAKYNTDVYNPYKSQVDAYNEALNKYNTEVYNPYAKQYADYEKAVNEYNAGSRESDYTGPSAPTLSKTFDMTAPTAPKAFGGVTPTAPEDFKGAAPTLPFKEEDVVKYQQEAADRARTAAGNRATAINVVSNPDQFNFGSMSVSDRFMAKGGEVMGHDNEDYGRTAHSVIKDFQEYGYTPEEIHNLAEEVAKAGRGGDELLAYLSPESMEFLKKHGGAGTINPMTSLPEFKGGVIGNLINAVKNIFVPQKAAPQAAAAPKAAPSPEAEAPKSVDAQPSAADLMKQLESANAANAALQTKYDTDLSSFKTQAQKDQEAAVAAALKADAEKRAAALAQPTMGQPTVKATPSDVPGRSTGTGTAADLLKQIGTISPSQTLNSAASVASTPSLDYRSPNFVGPRTTAEQGEYDLINNPRSIDPGSVIDMLGNQPGRVTPTQRDITLSMPGPEIKAPHDEVRMPTVDNTRPIMPTVDNTRPVVPPPDQGPGRGRGPIIDTFGPPVTTPKVFDPRSVLPGSVNTATAYSPTLSSGAGSISARDLAAVNLSAVNKPNVVQPLSQDFLKNLSKFAPKKGQVVGGESEYAPKKSRDGSKFYSGDTIRVNPVEVPGYSERGVGAIGSGNTNLAMPNLTTFGSNQQRLESMRAQNPNNYFALSQPGMAGYTPGTLSSAPATMPLFGMQNTANAMNANPNLSPTMLGGMQNAGVMTDRLGNRIYSPGMGPLFGYAKGGLAEMNASNLAEDDEQRIDTNPMGTAQQYLSDLSNLSPNQLSTQKPLRQVPLPKGGGSARPKSSGMAELDALLKGDLGAMQDLAPKSKDTDSAKAQMQELARQYKLKIIAAENKARGLSADTFGAPTLEQPTLTKSSLAKKRFQKGGEAKKDEGTDAPEITGVSHVMDFIAKRLPASAFPTAGRTFLETVQGNKGPITEANFSPEELDMMRKMVALKGGDSGNFQYQDYDRLSRELRKQGSPVASVSPSVFSMSDPMGNIQTTLGRFNYIKDPSGHLVIVDKYDFNPPMEGPTQEARTGDYGAFGPYGLIREYAGQKIPPGRGREVKINLGKPVNRADGSPEEGESLDKYYEPKAKPFSGKGRKEGEVSRQLKSGEAYVNLAKGATELPYDLAGAPVDIATLLMRPFGYSTEKPVMSSDWIKEKMTGAGVRPEPPTEPTAKGFYTAGEMLSNLTNPAGTVRKGVRTVQQAGQAAADMAKDFQQYNRQLSVPGASYAVRPTGSTMLTGNLGETRDRYRPVTSNMDQLLEEGMSNAGSAAGQNNDQYKMLQDFWNTKARNYFSRQFGTPDDPVARAISKKQLRGSALEGSFPEYLIDQLNVGKTRVNDQGQERFFPKYPRAMEDFQQRYDEATGLKGSVIAPQQGLGNPEYSYTLSQAGKDLEQLSKTREEDKLLTQGVRPELINSNVGVVTYSGKDPDKIIGGSTQAFDQLFDMYKQQQKTGLPVLQKNVTTAIEKGEPVYDIANMKDPLSKIFRPAAINEYLASIPVREAANMRFEDAVRGALKMSEDKAQMENLAARIKAGKPVADAVFAQGVSPPLMQVKQGPLEGFAWKRIEDRKATVPEGAYVGHSVGGYETGGIGYTTEKREGFNTGQWQIYTLRDNRNRPVNTIEVKMLDENTPVVTQIKGNGRATGNVPAEKYDTAILDFLQDYLRPAAIEEKDDLLTPVLKAYKDALGSTPRQ